MLHRLALPKIIEFLQRFPAVALLGPRQVGKTTLAHMVAGQIAKPVTFIDLELPSDRAKISDPEAYLAAHQGRLVIFDEVQRLPGLFQVLRGIIGYAPTLPPTHGAISSARFSVA